MGTVSGAKAISIKKSGHFYRFIYNPDEEHVALLAMLDTAENPELNLTLNDAIPFIEYLGYKVETLRQEASKYNNAA